jgi:predicted nuclease of predicted toxin-antitoxin system
MRLIVDAQLPRMLSDLLKSGGHDSIHTSELPLGNKTPDEEICRLAEVEGCIVVTKDSDFVTSHLLNKIPPQLLLVATGNISNEQLCEVFRKNLPALELAFESSVFVEINRAAMIVHQ